MTDPVPDMESLESQVDRLARFIMIEIPGEPSQSQGAVDTAIRLLRNYQRVQAENVALKLQLQLANVSEAAADAETNNLLAEKERMALRWNALQSHDDLFFVGSSGALLLNCNDVFAWEIADCEPVSDDALPLVLDLIQRFGDEGTAAWVSLTRGGMPPQNPIWSFYDKSKFDEAVDYIRHKEKTTE